MRISKQHILDELKRTADENGGAPLGRERFEKDSGIKPYHWQKFWARWSDAQREAGFVANEKNVAYSEEFLLDKLACLVRDLGRFPAKGDLRVRRQTDPEFPSANTFDRLGGKQRLVALLIEFCRSRPDLHDVELICPPEGKVDEKAVGAQVHEAIDFGFVYLLRSGRNYKIGKTNAVGRRERELAIQLPEKATKVHVIKTDDPSGIEAYWHKRFESKRKHGEWFELSATDVSAFKLRKFM